MIHLNFSKIKSTSELFFTREKIDVIIEKNSLSFSSMNYLFFSGTYYFHSIIEENSSKILYKASQAEIAFNDPNFDRMLLDVWYVYIAKSYKKIMIYNNNKEGVILKY